MQQTTRLRAAARVPRRELASLECTSRKFLHVNKRNANGFHIIVIVAPSGREACRFHQKGIPKRPSDMKSAFQRAKHQGAPGT